MMIQPSMPGVTSGEVEPSQTDFHLKYYCFVGAASKMPTRHFPKTNLNLDLGNSQELVRLSAQLLEQHSIYRSVKGTRSRQDGDMSRTAQGGHKLTYMEPQRIKCKDGS